MNKPGIKTTEFWIATLAGPISAIILALLKEYDIDISVEAVNIVVSSIVVYPITYIIGRIYGKGKIAQIELKKPNKGE